MSKKLPARLAGSMVDSCCCGNSGTMICRSKSGVACLCGFPPFGPDDLSRYRKRTTGGIMYQGIWHQSGCPDPTGQFTGYTFSGVHTQPGYPCQFDASGTITLVGKSGSNLVYKVTCSGNQPGYPPCANDGPFALQCKISFPLGSFLLNNNDTFNLAVGQSVTAQFLKSGQPIVPDRSVTYVGFELPTSIRDEWDVEDEYVQTPHDGAPTTCDLTQSDNTHRYSKAFAPFPLTSGGSLDDPAREPAASLVNETLMPTQRTLEGSEACVETSPGAEWTKAQGSIEEQLTDEDTIDDARARMEAGMEWTSVPSDCIEHTSYRTALVLDVESGQPCHGVRHGQVKISWTAVPEVNYRITIYLKSRPVGSAGGFFFYGQIEAGVIADQIDESTDWIDVPIVEGLEILAYSNNVALA